MAKLTKLQERQMIIDDRKWLDGIKFGKDMCGEYEFCSACDKSVEYPCAKAYNKMQKVNKRK